MKLILTIISDNDNDPVTQALIVSGFRVTRIASTGGFLRRGSSTLMIGVTDEKLDDAIQVIHKSVSPPQEPGMKRATLFVLNVEHFTQI
ncbi:MAG: hypothetical protein A2W35_00580 [Chloroflexi bacterium RBG_16_57_11]|nr:MAG: hypothetical protein A2W35_00580 [Chloroflexi bacterium RBG_16_57_11]